MVNVDKMCGTEHGDHLCDCFRSQEGVEEELSIIVFAVELMVNKVCYLTI